MVKMQNIIISSTIVGLHLWDIDINKVIYEVVNAHESKIISLSIAFQDHILSSSEDLTIKLWKFHNNCLE